jgi:hypothetical protein
MRRASTMSIPRTRNSCTAHADCLRAGKMLGKAKQQNSVLLTLMARKSVLSNPPAHQPCGFECCKALIFKDRETPGSSSPLIIQRDDRKFSRVRRVVACGSFQRKRAHVVCLGRNVRGNPKRTSSPAPPIPMHQRAFPSPQLSVFAAVWDNGIPYVRNISLCRA